MDAWSEAGAHLALRPARAAVMPTPRVTVGLGFNLTYDGAPPVTVPALDAPPRTIVGVKL